MEEKLLSVIVPIYNTEKYLNQCVQSILQQTYQNLEILLIDDGSTDGSLTLCRAFEKKDDRVHVIHKKNEGLIATKKVGLEKATGDYVGFVDSDDWIERDMYARLMKAAEINGADIVVGDNVIEYPDRTVPVTQGIEPGIYTKKELVNKVYPQLIFTKEGKLGFSPSLCTKIFKRKLVKKYQQNVDNSIKAGEDAACTYPCMLEAECIVYVKECYTYHYRIHDASMTHKRVQMDIEEKITLLNHLYDCFKKHKYSYLIDQLYLYSVNMLEAFIENAITNHIKESDLKKCIIKLQSSVFWSVFTNDRVPLGHQENNGIIIDYMKDPRKSNFLKLKITIQKKNLIQKIRIFLSGVKKKVMRI